MGYRYVVLIMRQYIRLVIGYFIHLKFASRVILITARTGARRGIGPYEGPKISVPFTLANLRFQLSC